jgi:hypothetical protein
MDDCMVLPEVEGNMQDHVDNPYAKNPDSGLVAAVRKRSHSSVRNSLDTAR